ETAAPVAVVSNTVAVARFGSATAALGKSIKLNDAVFTVVGVTSDGYEGLIFRSEAAAGYAMAIPMSAVPVLQDRAPGEPRIDMFVITRAGADSTRVLSALAATFARCCAAAQLAPPNMRRGPQRVTWLDVSTGVNEGKKIDVRAQYRGVLFALMAGVAVL